MSDIVVNSRILAGHLTGVQRYLGSILEHWHKTYFSEVTPEYPLHGVKGHFWEQIILPGRVGDHLLWSPSNTGPLRVKRQVVTIHDLASIDHPEFLNWKFAAWYKFLLPQLVNGVDHIIAISEFTKRRLVERLLVPEEKVSVVYNGVDLRFHVRSHDEILHAREKVGIPDGRYFFALGSLEPRKNLNRLLEAWSRVVSQLPQDVNLVVAGARGKSLVFGDVDFSVLPERVYLTGHVPDEFLPALYSGAMCAPYLSVYEGFGLPPLEAMACGAPVLTGNLTALPEVVGDAGIMVNPFSIDEIAEAIIEIACNDRLRLDLSQKGKVQSSMFSWKGTAEQTMHVLRKF